MSRWRYVGKKADPFYLNQSWRRLRVAVLQRDLYWCQICKKAWANTVHHIIPRSERPDLAMEMSNLQACCATCHNREHPEKGERPGSKPEEAGVPHGIRVIKV